MTDNVFGEMLNPVAALWRQGSQVTKVMRQVIRCKRQCSKGDGSFEVRKSSSQVVGCIFCL